MVHQREIRRPLATFCAESGTPLVAKRDRKAVADPELQIWGGGGHPVWSKNEGGGAGPSPGSAKDCKGLV